MQHTGGRGRSAFAVLGVAVLVATLVTTGGPSGAGAPVDDVVIVNEPSSTANPSEIVLGPDGAMWFTNRATDSLGRVTVDGDVTTYTDPTIDGPGGIVVGPDGNLWFTNAVNDSIGTITPAGVVTNHTDPTIDNPARITVGPDGNLWFTNLGNDSIGTITPGGAVTNHTDPTIADPLDIVSGPDGNLWFTNAELTPVTSVGRITPAGVVTDFADPDIARPQSITAGPDGNLWFTQYRMDGFGDPFVTLGRITPTGDADEFQLPSSKYDARAGDILVGPDNEIWFGTALGSSFATASLDGTITFLAGTSPGRTRGGLANGPDGKIWYTSPSTSAFARDVLIGRVTTSAVFETVATATRQPTDITAAPDGSYWFTNRRTESIGRMDPDGTIRTYTDPAIDEPEAIAFGPDGNIWFTTGFNTDTIVRMTPSGEVTVFEDVDINALTDITAGPDGNLWFTHRNEATIGRITPDGAMTFYFNAFIHDALSITAGNDGNLYFGSGDRLGRITTEGVITGKALTPNIEVQAVTAGPGSSIWFVAEGYGLTPDHVGRFQGGVVTTFEHPSIADPRGIVLGPDGNLWFTNYGNDSIGRVTPEGVVTNYTEPGIDGPLGMATGTDGQIWFTNENSNALSSVSLDAGEGQLRVTTDPAVPGTVIVDGIPRDSWGLTWLPIDAGPHEVCFGPVDGFTPPPCQDVDVVDGEVTVVEGHYEQRGFLQITTTPALPSTITVDGIPRNDWGVWTEVEPGTYDVCFGAVAGYQPPPCDEVEVTAGVTTTVDGEFTADGAAPGPADPHGFLRVTTDPAVASRITIDGEWADSWGLTWLKLAPGSYEVCFGGVLYATAPACETAVVTADATTSVTGTFVAHGFVQASTDRALPAVISIDGHPANAWGVWTSIEPGEHEVCFGPVPGYLTPGCQLLDVVAGATDSAIGTYTPE